jgi:Fanconi anemia group M protein
VYVEHPLIKTDSIEKRDYQINIAKSCMEKSTLVVLPTGMGKTIVALLVIAEKIKEGKVLFLAPTKPLVEQHYNFLKNFLLEDSITIFTGEVPPRKRQEMWKNNKIIVSTPQVIPNDIISGKICLDDVALIVFDEVHRATGEYAYVFIAEKYNGLVLGMTASPGSSANAILEVCNNLKIENVEIRSKYDPDVIAYVHDIEINWVKVDLPDEIKKLVVLLNNVLEEKIKELRSFGLIKPAGRVSTKELLDIQKRIQSRIKAKMPRPPPSLFFAATVQAEAIKINHAIELAETQGVSALRNYFDRLKNDRSKAAKRLINNADVQNAMAIALPVEYEHPKLIKVMEIVGKQLDVKKDSRIIVFTHYRDTSELVAGRLNSMNGVRAARFIGQADKNDDKGLRQKEQAEIIQKFKNNEYNVLVATSVGEEGLDIPETDLVVFYEPIPSEIRTIQRRGRTGRKRPGKVVMLITRKTRDEAYYWSALRKEKNMRYELQHLRAELNRKIGGKSSTKIETELSKQVEIRHDDGLIHPAKSITESSEHVEIRCGITYHPKNLLSRNMKGQMKLFDFKGDKKIPKKFFCECDGKMQSIFPNILGICSANSVRQESNAFLCNKISIVVDAREFNSNVVKELSRMDVVVVPRQLGTGDYVLSDRVGVERKEVNDFLSSMIDGRLFQQLKNLKNSYVRPMLVLEGEGLFTIRKISQNAIFGALACIVADYGIPIIQTKDEKETASLMFSIARREFGEGRIAGVRGEKCSMSLSERQQFIIEGLPNISGVLAQRLLSHFGSIKGVADAGAEELMEVKGVGKKKAEDIVKTLRAKYLR